MCGRRRAGPSLECVYGAEVAVLGEVASFHGLLSCHILACQSCGAGLILSVYVDW